MKKVLDQYWRVVKIAKKVPEGFAFQATGFAIPKGKFTYIVTNKHVIDKFENVSDIMVGFVPPIHGKTAELIYSNESHDLAILKSSVEFEGGEENTHLDLSHEIESDVFVLGYDESTLNKAEPRLQSGKIILSLPYVKEKNLFITSGIYDGETVEGLLLKGIESLGGSSGSPVFNNNGSLIGYLVARHNDGIKEAIGISIRKVADIINKL